MSYSKRSLRRHHRDRLNRRTSKILDRWLYSPFSSCHKEDLMYRVNRRRDNMQSCSCSMCGNPRRTGWNDHLTIKELSEQERFKYELLELTEPE